MDGERQWVRRLARQFPASGAVRAGIGDDAAVLRLPSGPDWVVTTDQTVEGVHFLLRRQSARAVGWKALARSLSDVAAMGGRPRFALVALTLTKRQSPKWLREFYGGLGSLAKRHGVQVIGGDFASGQHFVADVQVIGQVARGQALLRSGARAGHAIYVTGRLGLSALGERLADKSALQRLAKSLGKRALRAHFYPEARIEVARKLSRRLSAAMDLSDGLALDLHRLCEASGVGARLFRDCIPAVNIPAPLERRIKTTAVDLALHGGEDYELLFTAPKSVRVPETVAGISVARIGETTNSRAVVLCQSESDRKGVRLKPTGWDHFARRKRKRRR